MRSIYDVGDVVWILHPSFNNPNGCRWILDGPVTIFQIYMTTDPEPMVRYSIRENCGVEGSIGKITENLVFRYLPDAVKQLKKYLDEKNHPRIEAFRKAHLEALAGGVKNARRK